MNSAVIVAAGRATRMGAGVDKLFLQFAGRPVLAHTWQPFEDAPSIGEIIVVVRDGMQAAVQQLAAQHGFRKPHRVVAGGAERQDSVANVLAALAARLRKAVLPQCRDFTLLLGYSARPRPVTQASSLRVC